MAGDRASVSGVPVVPQVKPDGARSATLSQAATQAYEHLRAGILDGTYQPALRLGEHELAQSLGISRTPVREALRQLSHEGLVEVAANRGARVASYTIDDLDEIYDLREMMDSYAARRAAVRITDDELIGLDRLCDEMEEIREPTQESYVRLVRANEEFHRRIHQAAGYRRIIDLAAMAAHIPINLRRLGTYNASDLARSMAQHREILIALRQRDAEWAAAIAHAHTRASRYTMLRAVRRDEADGSG